MAHREIESIIRKLKDAENRLDDAFRWAEGSSQATAEAGDRISETLRQMQFIQQRMATRVITEALQASMEYMVSKYGHSSKEVKEVEQFIAHGTAL